MSENEKLVVLQYTENGKRRKLPEIIKEAVAELSKYELPKGHEYVLESPIRWSENGKERIMRLTYRVVKQERVNMKDIRRP